MLGQRLRRWASIKLASDDKSMSHYQKEINIRMFLNKNQTDEFHLYCKNIIMLKYFNIAPDNFLVCDNHADKRRW